MSATRDANSLSGHIEISFEVQKIRKATNRKQRGMFDNAKEIELERKQEKRNVILRVRKRVHIHCIGDVQLKHNFTLKRSLARVDAVELIP